MFNHYRFAVQNKLITTPGMWERWVRDRQKKYHLFGPVCPKLPVLVIWSDFEDYLKWSLVGVVELRQLLPKMEAALKRIQKKG